MRDRRSILIGFAQRYCSDFKSRGNTSMPSDRRQKQSHARMREESDLSLEVVVLLILGVFGLLYGLLLFKIYAGDLPYNPDSTYRPLSGHCFLSDDHHGQDPVWRPSTVMGARRHWNRHGYSWNRHLLHSRILYKLCPNTGWNSPFCRRDCSFHAALYF